MSRHHDLLQPARWRRTHRQIFERHGYRCRSCGRAGRLECDHVIPLEAGGDPYDLSNLQALCRGCHIAKTRREGPPRRVPEPVAAWHRLVEALYREGSE